MRCPSPLAFLDSHAADSAEGNRMTDGNLHDSVAGDTPEKTHGKLHDLGASLVEYALLVALIAVVCIGAITMFGTGGQNSLDHSTNSIVTATN